MATANVGNPTELWMPVQGFESSHMVSSLGRIKSIERAYATGSGLKRLVFAPESVLLPTVGPDGYCRIGLKCQPMKKTYLVHRLVALHFLPNPDGLETVNHINGIKTDNQIGNLEWCSQQDNNLHKYRVLQHKGSSAGKFGSKHHRSRTIEAVKNGVVIAEYANQREAQRIGGFQNTNINKALKEQIPYRGFYWRYKN